jgi:hypothetical protein
MKRQVWLAACADFEITISDGCPGDVGMHTRICQSISQECDCTVWGSVKGGDACSEMHASGEEQNGLGIGIWHR